MTEQTWAELREMLQGIQQGIQEERSQTQAVIARLTSSVETLAAEVEALRHGQLTGQRSWFSIAEAEPMIGLSSYAIRSRIRGGAWPQWTNRRANGCWRFKAGTSGTYEIHVENWQKQADKISGQSQKAS